MINRHARGDVHWIDLESPTRTELQEIMREFNVDPRIEEDVASETLYPIVASSKEYVYLVLHFPTTGPNGQAKNQEVDFIIGKDFLITIRYETIDSIHNLHKIFEAEELLESPAKNMYADALLERVLCKLYATLREDVESIGKRLAHIETDIFGGKERTTVRAISEINRALLRFTMAIGKHTESLTALLSELSHSHFFGKEFLDRAARIESEREHVATLVHSYQEVANELRDTNDSLLSASQNEVMKTLTVITVIILPLSLVVDLFQMTVPGVPLSHNPFGFWIISGLVILLTLFLVLYSKYKKWL